MRFTLSISILLLVTSSLFAQKTIQNTTAFVVEGLVRSPLVINLDSIKGLKSEIIDSMVITNHLGQKKSSLKSIRGVPLQPILEKAEIISESPKALSAFYFVFIASDGYKVVYSWNELFNNPTGARVYLIAEKDGKGLDEMEDKITVFSQTDVRTGRRYIKGLQKIEVKRAE